MVEIALLQRFLIALALGLLVGLEREYARYKGRGHKHAGIRTYALIALFGALSAYLGQLVNVWVFIVDSLIMGVFIIAGYFAIAEHERRYIGATSEIAGFVIFFVGALCIYGEIRLASLVTIGMTMILYARSMLHNLAKHMSKEEMTDTLKFMVIAFVVLPFLPDKGFGPYGLFNPYNTWLMVIFISAISFVGYILMKWYGGRGIPLVGVLGGLVSSTAVTTSFAQRSKKQIKIYKILALGVILANAIMFIRVLVEVFAVNKELFARLLLPFGILLLISAIFAYIWWHRTRDVEAHIDIGTPFALWPALKFALMLTAILALVNIAHTYFASNGVYVASFLSGFADVDAITLSLSQLGGSGVDMVTARNGILIAVLTNIMSKGAIAFFLGNRNFGKIVVGLFAVLIGVGVIMLVFF